jgi:NADH dehydrogenase
MGDIVIVGGGFAGLEAARALSNKRSKLGARRIIVIDAKETFDFLPVLPDVCGSFVPKGHVTLDLREYLEKLKVNFENDEVVKIDTDRREVFLKNGGILSFEFLIVSCGTVTNFYGDTEAERRALKLDTADDALVLLNTVTTYPSKKILIVGGGYTGVEIASSLAAFLRKRRIKKYSVNIIEKAEDILGPLPQWVKDYCRINLCALRVNIYADSSIKGLTDGRAKLSCGTEFEDYLLVWAAGVWTPRFVRDMKFEKDGQGRLAVDRSLNFFDRCFAIGDAACFKYKGRTLRMAVQFSIAEADVAAKNILRIIAGKKRLAKYRPMDYGLLVPMANKKACGKILFFNVRGILGWFLHYAMCIYRSISANNKFGIFGDLLARLFR